MTPQARRVTTSTAEGIFVCAAVGDALGWPQELRGGLLGGKKARLDAEPTMTFRRWERRGGYRAHHYTDPVLAGQYSDDTQLLMSVARSCLTGDAWLLHLTNVELPTWPLYQRGGGGAVLKASSSWADGNPPWQAGNTQKAASITNRYRGAGANGVAMRIAPHVCWADNAEELRARIFIDGITTHGHPRALVGALAFGSALQHAALSEHTLEFGELVDAARGGVVPADEVLPLLPPGWDNGGDFAALWEQTNREMTELLDTAAASLRRGALSNPTGTLIDLGCSDIKVNGAGTITAAGAIYLAARFGSRPDAGMLTAAYLPDGDTDTLASMTGAVLGAIHGSDWIPQQTANTLQDHAYIRVLATRNAARVTGPSPDPQTTVTQYRRAARAAAEGHDQDILTDFPDGRIALVASSQPLSNQATRLVIEVGGEQTVYVDIIGFGKPATPKRDTTATPDLTGDLAAAPRAGNAPTTANINRVTTIALPSWNLSRCAAFYARLLDRDLTIRDRALQIGPSLRLFEDNTGTTTAEVTVVVDNLMSAAARVGSKVDASAASLTLTDPDGRKVQVIT